MYDLILFDLDGTLADSKEGIINCVRYALESMGIKETNTNKLMKFIGPPLVDGFMEYYGMNRDDALSCVKKYRERYTDIGIFENSMYDGVDMLLKNLKNAGKTIALATSKPTVYAKRILEHFGIIEYFDILVGAEFDGTRNEKSEVIKEVLRQANGYNNPIMVGDRMHDCIGARENNLDCIGVLYGFGEDGELVKNGAIALVKTVAELEEMLLK